MSLYRSLIIAIAGAVLVAVQSALAGDSRIGGDEWIQVAIALVNAFVVWNTANTTGWRHGKVLAAAVLAALNGIAAAMSGGVTVTEWVNLAIQVAVAIGVLALPNRPPVTAQQTVDG